MNRSAALVFVFACVMFLFGWKAAGWQRDSVALAIDRTVSETGKKISDIAQASGRRLEDTLEALRHVPPREIRTEVVKPVFTTVCMSDDFVRMYNEASAATERQLSGKPAD